MLGVRWTGALVGGLSLVIVASVAGAAWLEMQSSTLQSAFFNRIGREYTFGMAAGPAAQSRYPVEGPYDERLGYTQLSAFLKRLTGGDYRIEAQARQSQQLREYMELGGFPPYAEKSSGGLTIVDRNGVTLFSARYPERVYDGYASVPKLIAETLLFIENRELLDTDQPLRNPAVEWDRFGMALVTLPLQAIKPDTQRVGGSTLATQIEKYRHSPGGQTNGGLDKLRQMLSASVRAYQSGYNTMEVRRHILVDYLNSTPLSARPGIGEINGLGDGLWAWYGTDFNSANRILNAAARDETALARQAIVYKQVLSRGGGGGPPPA
jgi:membrane peptidoglycan carboxypeptidase